MVSPVGRTNIKGSIQGIVTWEGLLKGMWLTKLGKMTGRGPPEKIKNSGKRLKRGKKKTKNLLNRVQRKRVNEPIVLIPLSGRRKVYMTEGTVGERENFLTY